MSQTKSKNAVIEAYFVTSAKVDPFQLFSWKKVNSEIKDQSGKVYFSMKNVEAPEGWSQLAIDIAASKYFRKSGVPGSKNGAEHSVRHMLERVVDAIANEGLKQKYFDSKKQSKIFRKELVFILLSQKASFNSPVWFNCGLFQSYKIRGESTQWVWNEKLKRVREQKGAYVRPQVSACFIQSVDDNLDSIFDLLKNEAKIFKYGSGSGTNFSKLRSKYEELSSGGTSSGLISFLEVLDKGAGAIKSGGTTRRAAKMVCLDVDHPEILDFIEWKKKEEEKAQRLIASGLSADFEGPAYKTVSGQNANNSVRVTDEFMKRTTSGGDWTLRSRVSGKVLQKIKASEIWDKIAESAWVCADPGMQFHDTIQKWHTCPQTDAIHASNPCSEYMFLDDSACNLASLNLIKFLSEESEFDWESYRHTARVMFMAQEILVDFASYPTKKIAENSHNYRPLGLGFAGLGACLMRMGLPYDSNQGRAWAGALTALLHGEACLLSSEIAKKKKPFAGFKKNRTSMLAVMKKHQEALKNISCNFLPDHAQHEAQSLWNEVLFLGKKYGYRNAQASVMAPTGTIGLVMDCDTTGVEPEFSLVKYKKLVGGGRLRIVSQSVEMALKKLGYTGKQSVEILKYIDEHSGIEGAPHIRSEHLSIFDGAQKNGVYGKRILSADAHLKMMAAIQPFLSGAISKTVNLSSEATIEDIKEVYRKAWELGLKAVAIYRDSSKLSQPLSHKNSEEDAVEVAKPVLLTASFAENGSSMKNMKCPDCGGKTELSGGCFRCTNCGFTTGCVS